MVRTVNVGGIEMRMRASALIPRFYRFHFGRDIIVDMKKLAADYEKGEELDVIDLTIFENVAWLMAYEADPDNTPETPDEWLDSIDGVFSVYEALPQILGLWADSQKTTAIPKKKRG